MFEAKHMEKVEWKAMSHSGLLVMDHAEKIKKLNENHQEEPVWKNRKQKAERHEGERRRKDTIQENLLNKSRQQHIQGFGFLLYCYNHRREEPVNVCERAFMQLLQRYKTHFNKKNYVDACSRVLSGYCVQNCSHA